MTSALEKLANEELKRRGLLEDEQAIEDSSDKEAIKSLASLSHIDYDRRRKSEAERLGVRVEVLDKEVKAARGEKNDDSGLPDVEPWGSPIEPAKLLNDISETILKFIVCNKETAEAAALWVSMTWLIDAVQVAPLAVVTAPEKRCGKTNLLTILGKLSYRPLMASSISAAALYRCIEAWQPTLLLDETDAFLKENEELRGVINSGHTRDNAYVIRTVGDDHTPKRFSTWGAKALSGIGHLSDTLMDRAIILELRRKLAHEEVKRLRHAEPDMFITLSRKLARFAIDYRERVQQARPSLPESLNDRAQDNWEPLLAIADVAGGEWPKRGRDAAIRLSGSESNDQVMTAGIELLMDIKSMFEERKVDRVRSRDLVAWLCEDDEKPWATYNRGKPIAARQISKKLSGYGIKTNKTINFGANTAKGYFKSSFTEAWCRYLPPDTPDLSVTIGNSVTSQYPRGFSSYRYEKVTDNIGNQEKKRGENDGQTVTVTI